MRQRRALAPASCCLTSDCALVLEADHQLELLLQGLAGLREPAPTKKVVVAEQVHFRTVRELFINGGNVVGEVELLHYSYLPLSQFL